MTLTMTIVAPWGVWMCSDHRLTRFDDQDQAAEISDLSMKHITLRSADGEALITYTGMGTVEDDVHVSEWLRRLLRNENWNVDQIQTLIRHWATAKWGPALATRGRPHTFVVGAFSHGRPRAAEITNVPGPPGSWPLPHFVIKPYPADEVPLNLVRGAGREAICEKDWALLDRITHRQPKRAKSYMRVLAGIHRRAQQSDLPGSETISEGCMTTSMPPNYGTDETGHLEQLFHWSPLAASDRSPPMVPILSRGLDLTALDETMALISPFMEAGQAPPQEALDRWRQAIKRAILAPPEP